MFLSGPVCCWPLSHRVPGGGRLVRRGVSGVTTHLGSVFWSRRGQGH